MRNRGSGSVRGGWRGSLDFPGGAAAPLIGRRTVRARPGEAIARCPSGQDAGAGEDEPDHRHDDPAGAVLGALRAGAGRRGACPDRGQWRSLATRYDKLAVVYRAGAVLRAVTLWLKRLGDMP